jgi:hypothetical protein
MAMQIATGSLWTRSASRRSACVGICARASLLSPPGFAEYLVVVCAKLARDYFAKLVFYEVCFLNRMLWGFCVGD